MKNKILISLFFLFLTVFLIGSVYGATNDITLRVPSANGLLTGTIQALNSTIEGTSTVYNVSYY